MANGLDKPNEISLLKELRAEFIADLDAESSWREQKIQWGNFYDGYQLSQEEIDELEKRGQPAVVINRVKPKLDAIFGIQSALQVDTKVYPAGETELEAEEVSQELRRIEDESELDLEETYVFEDICIDGRAWYKCFKEFDGIQGIDKVKQVNNDNVVLDRNTNPKDLRTGELRSSKRIHETVWMEVEDAKEMFPAFADKIDEALNRPDFSEPMLGNKLKEHNPDQYAQVGGAKQVDSATAEYLEFINKKRKKLRVVTTYIRKPVVSKFIRHSGGTAEVTENSDKEIEKLKHELEGATSWAETRYSINSKTFIWSTVLEEKNDIRPYDRDGKFPLIMVPAYVSRNDKKMPYGFVKQLIDPQRELNKRRSKNLHLLNVNQTWFEDGAFENEPEAKRQVSRPDGWIKYRKDFKVDSIKHLDMAQSHFLLLQETKRELDASGVQAEIEGVSRATSGVDFRLRQQQAMQPIRKLFVALRGARKRVAGYLIDEILYRRQDLEIRKYDVVIEEAPESISLQSEVFQSLVSLANSGVPIPPDMILENSPLSPKKKQEALERLAASQQQHQQLQLAQMQLKAGTR